MRPKSRTAVVLVTVAAALVPCGSAVAMPVRDVATATSALPVVTALPPVVNRRIAATIDHPAAVTAGPRAKSSGSGGIDTPAVLLLAIGALLAGAAMGFGGARVRATRAELHPH